MTINERFDFLGTKINITNLERTTDFLTNYNYDNVGYVAFPDSSVVAAAQRDMQLQTILNNSLLTLPDGKPSELWARVHGHKEVSTVSGFWLCKNLFKTKLTHYFLGSTDVRLKKMVEQVKTEFPNVCIAGYRSLPFHDLEYFKAGNLLTEALTEINTLKPDLIWIGISSPKQDFLMRTHAKELKHGVMLGVGGVFDYLSGDVKKSPEWVKKIGMRWLWRLVKEPGRLGAKYAMTFQILLKVIVKRLFAKQQS
ncbi:MAG TPA: WecB/TagA/CpsF family glycosyltransferase [Ohtaekwangia sp.]|nr:WecB/TagA/CpsF family glycosyltransferase [Ohtaekwangia sp.]